MKSILLVVVGVAWARCVLGQSVAGQKVPEFKSLSEEESAQLSRIHQNWSRMQSRMCELTEPETRILNDRVEECNKMSAVYRVQQLLKPCLELKAVSNASNYLQLEQSECKYEQCYLKVLESAQYQSVMGEVARMENAERLQQAEKRLECAFKVLSI